jgi:hypothetical protein
MMYRVPTIRAYCPSCDPDWISALVGLGHLLNPDDLSASSPGPHDWGRLIRVADSLLLSPALFREIRRKKLDVPDEGLEYLAVVWKAHQQRSQALHAQLEELAKGFADRGVTPIFLKGAAILAQESEPGEAARPVRDLDILVDPQHLDVAADVLKAQGYSHGHHGEDERWSEFHHMAPRSRRGSPAEIELHRHPIRPEIWERFDQTSAFQTATVPFAGTSVKVPIPLTRVLMAFISSYLQDDYFRRHAMDVRRMKDVVDATRSWDDEWHSLEKLIPNAEYRKPFEAFLSQLAVIFGSGPPGLREKAQLSPILLAKYCCGRFDGATRQIYLRREAAKSPARKKVRQKGPPLIARGTLSAAWQQRRILSEPLWLAAVCLQHRIQPWKL